MSGWALAAAAAAVTVAAQLLVRRLLPTARPLALAFLALVTLAGLFLLPVALVACWTQSALSNGGVPALLVLVGASVVGVGGACAVRAVVTTIRTGRAAMAYALAGATSRLGPDVLVVPLQEVTAFVTGGRVVVSERALDVLEPEQLRAVLAHEQAHVEGRHGQVATAAGALRRGLFNVPVARRIEALLRAQLELLADEQACAVGGRAGVTQALTRLVAARGVGCGAERRCERDRLRQLSHPARRTPGPDVLVWFIGVLVSALVLSATCLAVHHAWLYPAAGVCLVVLIGLGRLLLGLLAAERGARPHL